jgi:hypothetical protein
VDRTAILAWYSQIAYTSALLLHRFSRTYAFIDEEKENIDIANSTSDVQWCLLIVIIRATA